MRRREILSGLLGIGLGGTVAACSPRSADPSVQSVSTFDSTVPFDLAQPGVPMLNGIELHDSTIMQSFAFDGPRRLMFTAQVLESGHQFAGERRALSEEERGAQGDLCVSCLDLDGRLRSQMYLLGFGHGLQIGIEFGFSASFLWIEADARQRGRYGWGTALTRLRFVDGGVINSADVRQTMLRPPRGHTELSIAVDPSSSFAAVRYLQDDGYRYSLHALDELRAGKFTPLAVVAEPLLESYCQGFALLGDFLYIYEGSHYGSGSSVKNVGNARLQCIDWRTGVPVQRTPVMDGLDLPYREPEGIAILQTNPLRPADAQLCYGFAVVSDDVRNISMYAKPLVPTTTRVG